jgi:transposase
MRRVISALHNGEDSALFLPLSRYVLDEPARREAFYRLRRRPVSVIIDRRTGETRPAQIFVAVMGASSLSCEAAWTQTSPGWTAAHVRAFEAMGGVPKFLVPDNAGYETPRITKPTAK